jgi:hypothetical protein
MLLLRCLLCPCQFARLMHGGLHPANPYQAHDEEVARQAAAKKAHDEEVARQAAAKKAHDEEVARQQAAAAAAAKKVRDFVSLLVRGDGVVCLCVSM